MPAKAFPELGLNMVHVDDVADGIMLAHDKGKVGESYVLGGEITTQGELIDKAAAIGGKKPPRMTVPPIVAQGDDPGGPLGRSADGPAAELPRDDLGRPQRDLLGEGRQGPRASSATQPRDLDTGLQGDDRR